MLQLVLPVSCSAVVPIVTLGPIYAERFIKSRGNTVDRHGAKDNDRMDKAIEIFTFRTNPDNSERLAFHRREQFSFSSKL